MFQYVLILLQERRPKGLGKKNWLLHVPVKKLINHSEATF